MRVSSRRPLIVVKVPILPLVSPIIGETIWIATIIEIWMVIVFSSHWFIVILTSGIVLLLLTSDCETYKYSENINIAMLPYINATRKHSEQSQLLKQNQKRRAFIFHSLNEGLASWEFVFPSVISSSGTSDFLQTGHVPCSFSHGKMQSGWYTCWNRMYSCQKYATKSSIVSHSLRRAIDGRFLSLGSPPNTRCTEASHPPASEWFLSREFPWFFLHPEAVALKICFKRLAHQRSLHTIIFRSSPALSIWFSNWVTIESNPSRPQT